MLEIILKVNSSIRYFYVLTTSPLNKMIIKVIKYRSSERLKSCVQSMGPEFFFWGGVSAYWTVMPNGASAVLALSAANKSHYFQTLSNSFEIIVQQELHHNSKVFMISFDLCTLLFLCCVFDSLKYLQFIMACTFWYVTRCKWQWRCKYIFIQVQLD